MDHDKILRDDALGLNGSEISGKPKKSKRKMSEHKKSQSLEEPVGEGFRNGHNPPLSRSKTYDPSFCKEGEKEAGFVQHRNSEPSISNLMKHTINFRRVFKDLPEEEELLETFSCAWQREVPYHGRLYVSQNHVCFYCSMIRREVKVIIPVPTISVLKKANTALLVPNAICIRTEEGEKFLFSSLRSRESAYRLLRSICKHLQDGARNHSLSTPYASTENLLKISLMSKELDSNHHSPEYEILPEESDEPDGMEAPLCAPNDPQKEMATGGGREQSAKTPRRSTSPLNPLNTVILIYLILVVVLLLSSGYIGLRIVQLEEQLTSMGAWPELDLHDRYKAT
ncbi:GRAM domain-containing protein 2A-like [Sceloporus undulatus]|uniref:GRAM domain-containing protein 2A-like n=1 Tax=Sceloporus undulatus TaxID=8520 RepID=UPI001C4BA28F|nr:GRAM domain-containing protein 2A-like [Sceloporus undulatus]